MESSFYLQFIAYRHAEQTLLFGVILRFMQNKKNYVVFLPLKIKNNPKKYEKRADNIVLGGENIMNRI